VVEKLDTRRRLQTERKRRRSDQMDAIDWAITGQSACGRNREYGRLWFPSKCVLKAIEDQLASPRRKTLVLYAVNQKSAPCPASAFLQQCQKINRTDATASYKTLKAQLVLARANITKGGGLS